MTDSKSKKRPAQPVIDFDEAMKYSPLAVPAGKRARRAKSRRGPGKESTVTKNLDLTKIRAGLQSNHGGPGPHKDGSSQDVHGKKSSGGGSRPRGSSESGKPEWVKSKFGNRIVGSGNPLVGEIKAHNPKDRLAYGFKFGEDVKATLDDGSVETGMLVHYKDDHFFVEIDGSGWTEVYKSKVEKLPTKF